MKKEDFFELLGDLEDDLVLEAGREPSGRRDSRRLSPAEFLRRGAAVAAVVALMLCSGVVGALAFSRETVVEVPAEAETVHLEELGMTLLLPDDWKGRYTVIQDTFVPYSSTMWEFCAKAVYDAKRPADEEGEVLYRGTLFTILQIADYPMSLAEFQEDSGIAGIGQYLFSTENATYGVMYASDVQFDPDFPGQDEEYTALSRTMKDIKFIFSGLMDQEASHLCALVDMSRDEYLSALPGEEAKASLSLRAVYPGSYTAPNTRELLCLISVSGVPHAGGLDRTILLLTDGTGKQALGQVSLAGDGVDVVVLTDREGRSYPLFLGVAVQQGIHTYTIEMYQATAQGFAPLPALEELPQEGDLSYSLLADGMLQVSQLLSAEFPGAPAEYRSLGVWQWDPVERRFTAYE